MDPVLAFLVLGAVILIGFGAEVLFKRTKIPDIIILLIVGAVLGRFYDVTSIGGIISLFTTFALIFILFEGALRLKIKQLFSQLPRSMFLTLLSFVFTVTITYALGMAMGLGNTVSLYLGFMLGGTSSAVVIPLVKFAKVSRDTNTILTLESAFSDVLCILSTVIFTQILVVSQVDPSNLINNILGTITIALAIGAVGGFAWAYVLKHWASDSSYFLTVALLLIMYSVTEFVQANGAIACLVFGLVLGNAIKVEEKLQHTHSGSDELKITSKQVLSNSARNFYSEISFFVKTFFFVYLGMIIDFSSPASFVYGFVIVLGFLAIRPLAGFIARTPQDPKDKTVVQIMVPKGLAAAVLASVPIQAGIAGTEIIPNIVLAAILLSIVGCSVLLFLAQRGKFKGFYSWLTFGRE